MDRFIKIITDWINNNTIDYDYPLPLHVIRTFTEKNRNIDDFNSLTYCKFIEYNGIRRIIPRDGGDRHYFTLPEWDGKHIEYETCFDNLILKLFSHIYRPGEGILDDTIMVNIQDVKDTLKYFNIDYEFNVDPEEDDYRIENGFYKYEGDDWDDGAMHYFHSSEIYKLTKEALIKYFKYDFAPYTKYNPNFNPFEVDTKKLGLDDKIKKLSLDQLGYLLYCELSTENVFESHSEAKTFFNNLAKKIDDKDTIKKLLLSMDDSKYNNSLKDKERRLCNKIEYILNI